MATATSPKPLEDRQLRLVFDAANPKARITTNVIPIRPNVVVSTNHPAVATKVSQAKQPIQLTVRGRRLAAVLALVPIVAALVIFGGKVAQANAVKPKMTTVVVAPGQSLWDLASKVDPNSDPRAVVLEIEQLNGLATADIAVGQQLIVPVK